LLDQVKGKVIGQKSLSEHHPEGQLVVGWQGSDVLADRSTRVAVHIFYKRFLDFFPENPV
jgi:hypothetical protein